MQILVEILEALSDESNCRKFLTSLLVAHRHLKTQFLFCFAREAISG